MKKLILIAFALSLCSCKSLWNLYKPVQSEIVGKKVVDYNSKSNYIALGEINSESGDISTKDFASSATLIENLEKEFKLDIKGFFTKNVKVENIEVTNAKVTQISSIKDMEPGNFVYAAIKADKVIVSLKNESNTEIKPEELAKELEQYVKSLNPTVTEVAKMVKEISFNSKSISKYEITNPEVYYFFQEARILENQGIKNKWFKSFTTIMDGEFKLNSENPTSKTLYPVISKKFKDKVDRIGVQLLYEKNNDKPELYVRYTVKNKTEKKKIPRLSEKVWDEMNFLIKEYDLSSDSYKVVRMDIKARQIDDEIMIQMANVSYPEKRIEIIKN